MAPAKGRWQDVRGKVHAAQAKVAHMLDEREQLKAQPAQQALDAFYAGLLEQAGAAAERGDTLFTLTLSEPDSTSHSPLLNSVEALGWRLQNVDHVHVPKTETGTYGSGASTIKHGMTLQG